MTGKDITALLDEEVVSSPIFLEAVTHRSAGSRHNERLEFLGDSILSLVVSEHIFAAQPQATEGELSRLRASLVNKDSLAAIAREYHLGDAMRLGQGELKSGGFRRDSILADGLEAVMGAVFLIKGMAYVRDFIKKLYAQRLTDLPSADDLKDPKTKLQEFLQARGLALPKYEILEVSGAAHRQHFRARCGIEGFGVEIEGEGGSRRKAEQACAAKALELLIERDAAT